MHSIKTPDSCFQNMQDFPYVPNYQTIEDGDGGELTMHYLEEGPLDGPLICVFMVNRLGRTPLEK